MAYSITYGGHKNGAVSRQNTHGNFGVDDVGDAAENDDEVEHVPRITEIVLHHHQHEQRIPPEEQRIRRQQTSPPAFTPHAAGHQRTPAPRTSQSLSPLLVRNLLPLCTTTKSSSVAPPGEYV